MGKPNEKVKISQEAQKQVMVRELLNLGITENKNGTSIDDLDYYSLRSELAIARYKRADIENSESKWF